MRLREKREEKLLFTEMGPQVILSAAHSSESLASLRALAGMATRPELLECPPEHSRALGGCCGGRFKNQPRQRLPWRPGNTKHSCGARSGPKGRGTVRLHMWVTAPSQAPWTPFSCSYCLVVQLSALLCIPFRKTPCSAGLLLV